MSKQAEMEATFESYKWLIREKLVQLDSISRSMFVEMGVFSIPVKDSRAFVQQKFMELVAEVTKEGDTRNVKNYRLRGSQAVNKRHDKDIQTKGERSKEIR